MKAQAGDRLRFRGAANGHCDAEILMVRGRERGDPPYLVRFDDGRLALVVPGPDAVLDPVSLADLDVMPRHPRGERNAPPTARS